MHTVTIPEGISESIPVAGGLPMEAGKSYICTNAFTGSLLMSNWRVMIGDDMWKLSPLLKAVPFEEEKFNPEDNWNGKSIWIKRGGGWGDLLMLTPVIRELKKRWPTCQIHVARGDAYAGIYRGLDITEELLPIEDKRIEWDCILVSFEEWIEGHPEAEKVHMAQHFANKFGIDLDGDHKPDYVTLPEEEAWQVANFPRLGGPRHRIGIQFMASSMYRNYPFMNKIIPMLLANEETEIFLFGAPGQLEMNGEMPPRLTNLTEKKYECDFRRSAAIAKSCDCIVSPDSAMVHLASALGVPYVGLYGPIPPSLRGSGKGGKCIQGMAPCSPCFYHAARPTDFPEGKPCQEAKQCVALAEITPEQVVETVMKLISPIIQLPKKKQGGIILP